VSIRPIYASKILIGQKTIEQQRKLPVASAIVAQSKCGKSGLLPLLNENEQLYAAMFTLNRTPFDSM